MTSRPPSSRRNLLAAIVVAAVALGVYAGTLAHGFVFDDGPEVVDNVFLRRLSDVPQIFATASWEGAGSGEVPMYRPLTTVSYALNYAAGGFTPFGFHLVNVLLHALVTVLVLWLALRSSLPLVGAVAAALLFAVMPAHVEAVANIAGRKELLVAAFSVGAVIAHASALREGGAGVVIAPILVLFALFSKESGIASVGLITAHDLCFGREGWRTGRRRALTLYGAYGSLVVGFVLARHAVLGTLVFPGIPFDENPVANAATGVRVMTAIAVLGRGLLLLVAPVSLSPDYSFGAIPPVTSPADIAFLASALALCALTTGAVAWRRRFPLGLFGLLWYGLSILPASNLLVPIGTIFGERLLYVPSVGVALVAGGAVASVRGMRTVVVARGTLALLILAYAARTVQYARAWSDELSVFSAAVSAQPRSAKAWRMLGGALMESGRTGEAARAFENAIAILERSETPPQRISQPRVELSVALERLARPREAEAQLARVLRDNPMQPDALWRLGVLTWQRGDRSAAADLWRKAVSAAPGHARAWNDLGIAAFTSGDAPAAEKAWRHAAGSDPTLASPLYRLGNLYEQQGRTAEARSAWLAFLERAHETYPEWRAEVAAKLGTTPTPR